MKTTLNKKNRTDSWRFRFMLTFILGLVTIGVFFFCTKQLLANLQKEATANVEALPTETLDLGGVKMEFVLIPPGTFIMGSDEETGDGDEKPAHKVTLTQPFYLGKYEVTQEQWVKVIGSNPSKFKGPKLPVDSVSWDECQRFLLKLQEMDGRKFTLPTEAQWEYACRAGTISRCFFGDNYNIAGNYAWIATNSGNKTHQVGKKKPNPWGIYDIYGNVQELCADWYANPYQGIDATNPLGPSHGDSRILRGGAWGDDPMNIRSAYRNAIGQDIGNDGIGLRCVMLH